MSPMLFFGVLDLCTAICVVASGIHIRTAAPEQRRNAWVTFGFLCITLAFGIGIWWLNFQSGELEAFPPALSGWPLACLVLPLLIMLPIVSIGALIKELRQAFADRTTSMDVPPEAG